VDTNALRNPGLVPDQYLQGILTDASEQDIDDYQQALQKLRNRASTDLQQNVYQNRTQFIKISKEAEKLKGEMRALRNLMSELKTNTTALRAASSQGSDVTNDFDSGFPTTLSKRDRRSSVADRTAMWNSQLQVTTLKCIRFLCLVLIDLGLVENY
jgi:soluble cytochrome b562